MFTYDTLGRWLARDPIGYKDGMNLYEYVAAKPLVNNDPLGQSWAWEAKEEYRVQKTDWFEPGIFVSAESANVQRDFNSPAVAAGSPTTALGVYLKATHQVWSYYSIGFGETGYTAKKSGDLVFSCDKDSGAITWTGSIEGNDKSDGEGTAFAAIEVSITKDTSDPTAHTVQIELKWSAGVGKDVKVTTSTSTGGEVGAEKKGVSGKVTTTSGTSTESTVTTGKRYSGMYTVGYVCKCKPK